MICRIRQAKEYRGKTSIYDALNAETIGDDEAITANNNRTNN